MPNRKCRSPRRYTRAAVWAVGLALSAAACLDLDTFNPDAPDRERALGDPESLLSVFGSIFDTYYDGVYLGTGRADLFTNYGTEFTWTNSTGGIGFALQEEPRVSLPNTPSLGPQEPAGPRQLWSELHRSASIAYDALQTLNETGVTLRDGGQDVTARSRAYAKLIQGMSWGYLAVMYDQAVVLHESVRGGEDAYVQMRELLVPRAQVLDAALEALAEARVIAQQNQFSYPTYPNVLWFASPTPVTSQDIVQLANTLSARFLVLSARTPAERRNVDWVRVLQFTENGLTRNIETTLASAFRESQIFASAQSVIGSRWDPRAIGPADVSGAYQAWINAPLSLRNRFNIETPDRRITGETPTSDGSYTAYRADDQGFSPQFGTHLFSAYQWRRHQKELGLTGELTGPDQGTARIAALDENRLLRAEALIYLNNSSGAVALINETRTRPRLIGGVQYPGLPPVTINGAPHSAPGANDCVPRTDNGACGDLMVALRYERMIELAGLDGLRGYADSRGFGILPDGSWLELPVPGNEANQVSLEIYTFGGIGGASAAVYAPVTMNNVP